VDVTKSGKRKGIQHFQILNPNICPYSNNFLILCVGSLIPNVIESKIEKENENKRESERKAFRQSRERERGNPKCYEIIPRFKIFFIPFLCWLNLKKYTFGYF
jgi:hypothetical protein